MENQKVSSKQVMLNYGLILGVVSIFISLLNYSFGDIYKPHWSIQVAGLLSLIIVIFLGIKQYKFNNSSSLKLGQGLKIGLGIALIGAVISLIYTFIFVKFIEPEFVVNTIELETQKMIDAGNTDEQIEMAIGIMKNWMMFMISAMIIIMNLFIGFIVSLITSLALKSE